MLRAGIIRNNMTKHSTEKRKKPVVTRDAMGRALLYFIMTVAVIAIVAILVLIVRGYRYSSADGQFIQGGLLQHDSRPNGADVYLDETRLGNKTPNKVTVVSGTHTITMKKEGYDDWSKQVTIVPGTVLWLNYARLVPTTKQTSVTAEFPAVSSALPSPDRKTMAIVGTASEPVVNAVPLDADTPRKRTVTIAQNVLSPAEDVAGQKFELMAWDHDSRYVLVKRSFDTKQEWLVVDTRSDNASLNVTTSLGVDIAHAEFKYDNNRVLYALTTNGELRRLDLGARSMSGPILSRLAEFGQYDASTVTYVTQRDEQTGKRSAGYYTEGASQPRALKTYADEGTTPLHLRIGKYFGKTYVAIAYGETLDITTGDLPASGAKSPSALTQVASLTLPAGVDRIGFSARDARFAYAESAESVSVFDLELQTFSTTQIKTANSRGVTWVDREHFTTENDGVSLYDFDGTNRREMTQSSLPFPAAISANNKYMYSIAPTDDGAALVRTKLRTDRD